MKKTHHSTSAVVVTVLLIGGGMFSLRDMDVYGQSEQPTPPYTSLLSNSQASEEWMTSFDLEIVISLLQARIAISFWSQDFKPF